jgi:hypothetical protein
LEVFEFLHNFVAESDSLRKSKQLKAHPISDAKEANELLLSQGFSSDGKSLSVRFETIWIKNLLENGDYERSQIDKAIDYLGRD